MTAVDRLGWVLIHFCWQGAAIAALYAAARIFARRPESRYLLACGALAAMLAAPVATWFALSPAADPAPAPDRTARVPGPVSRLPVASELEAPSYPRAPWLRWTVVVWLAGVSILSLRLAGGWARVARLRWKHAGPAPLEWRQRFDGLRARLGLPPAVRLGVSALLESPVAIGVWRPLVLVPAGMLAGLPADQVEALLIHELAHIRRHDYLVNLLQSGAESLLFYHPAVWWVSGHIRREREHCCDDAAVAASGDVLGYVSALAELESSRRVPLAAASNSGSLAGRIARLLGESGPARTSSRGPLAVLALLLAAAYGVFAQSEARPSFQVASVKLNTENPQHHIVRPQAGGRLMAENAPLDMLIFNAYGVQSYQVVGGPGWIHSDGFDIEAKPDGQATTAQVWLMLQSLLADRFKLALHRETRQLPVYSMTGAKGLFNPPAPKEPCVAMPPGPPQQPGTFPCGRVGINGAGPSGLEMNGRTAPMAEFVRMLALVMGRPVINDTGFNGELDVHLAFAPDESTQGLPGSGPGAFPPSDPSRPNVFGALQEQMGLKLTSSKGPVEVLVIDHAERPTVN